MGPLLLDDLEAAHLEYSLQPALRVVSILTRARVMWRRLSRTLRATAADQQGVTLAEVLVATALLAIGMVAVLSAMSIGLGGVESSRRVSTALFLAEQRLEQVRAFSVSNSAGQGFGNLATAAFPAEGYNTIAGYGGFRRVVTVTPNAGGNPNLKAVIVQVFYAAPTAVGTGETGTAVETVVALR
jgi:prepilin-type N-terminal cleavage/methylation domain-containing protein